MLHPAKQAHNFGYYYLGLDEDFAHAHGICCLSASWWAFVICLNANSGVVDHIIDNLCCEYCRRTFCIADDMTAWK